jgi:hypothetical protein
MRQAPSFVAVRLGTWHDAVSLPMNNFATSPVGTEMI